MLRSRHWLLVLAASVPCVLLLADDDAEDADARIVDIEVDWERWKLEEDDDDDDDARPIILEGPLRLEFRIDDAEEHKFDVVCAAQEYGISIDISSPDQENHVDVAGMVQPLNDGERMFVTFSATLVQANLLEGGEATFSAEGSTILTLGQSTRLATFPGPSLSLTVSPAE